MYKYICRSNLVIQLLEALAELITVYSGPLSIECLCMMYFFNTGIPTIHDKGLPIQPDYNGSFSYGALVNTDGTAHPPAAPGTELKKD